MNLPPFSLGLEKSAHIGWEDFEKVQRPDYTSSVHIMLSLLQYEVYSASIRTKLTMNFNFHHTRNNIFMPFRDRQLIEKTLDLNSSLSVTYHLFEYHENYQNKNFLLILI